MNAYSRYKKLKILKRLALKEVLKKGRVETLKGDLRKRIVGKITNRKGWLTEKQIAFWNWKVAQQYVMLSKIDDLELIEDN